MLAAEHDVHDYREDRRLPLCLEVEALQRHETPDMLVARRRNTDLAGEASELPSYVGEGRVSSSQRFEVFHEPYVESGRRGSHPLRLAHLPITECEKSVPRFAL